MRCWDAPLFFANADNFRKSVLELVTNNQPKTIVIYINAVILMDMDGDKILAKLSKELQNKNVRLS